MSMRTGSSPFRRRLDPIDDEIARLLGERFEICREVARYKSEHGIPMMQPERVAEVRARYLARGAEADLAGRLHRRPLRAADRRHLQARGRADGGAPRREGARRERRAASRPAHAQRCCSRSRWAQRAAALPRAAAGSATATPSPCACATSAPGSCSPTPRTSNGSSPPAPAASASACQPRAAAGAGAALGDAERGARAHGRAAS